MPAIAFILLAALFLFGPHQIGAEVEDLRDEADKPKPAEPGIPEITSQEDLEALKPFTLFDGWEVRLAIAPGDFTAKPADPKAAPDFSKSPWRILYADFRRTLEDAEFPHTGILLGGEPIGPFEFDLDFDSDGIFDRGLIEKMLMERMDMLREKSDHYLFAATIPSAAKGGYRLRVYPTLPVRRPEPEGGRKDLIAESIWKQDAPIPVRWVEFAKSQYVDLPDLGIPVPDEMTHPFVPSAPKFDGHQSLISSRAEEKLLKEGGRTALPGMTPVEPDPGFKISLAGSGIAIELKEPAGTEIEHFLARWWIDGKPVAWTFDEIPVSKMLDELERMRLARENEKTFTTRIPFRPPLALKGSKPDSKITLQLLYSPTGTEELANPEEVGMEKLRHVRDVFALRNRYLRLSNRIDFKFGDVVGSK